jgi:hypothetical protein
MCRIDKANATAQAHVSGYPLPLTNIPPHALFVGAINYIPGISILSFIKL